MLPSRSLLPTNHFGTNCCCSGPYLPPTTSEPTAQHVAVAVPTSHQPLRNRLLSMLPSRSLLPTNHFGTDRSACCRRGPYFLPTTSEPTAQHVAVAVPTSHQPLRNRPLCMLPSRSLLPTNRRGLPSRSLLPTNHFGTDRSACCRRGPYFLPTTSEPTAQHVAVAVPTSHQPLRNRPLCMLPSRSLLPTNHFGTECSACCRRGPYFPPTTSEPTAQHVAVAVPTSHQPLRKRLHSMLPSRSLLPPTTSSRSLFLTNHFGTDCSACCCRGPYFPPTTSEPTPQHVAVAVPTPTNHFVAVPISHQPRNLGIDCPACCCRGPYFPPTTSEPTAQHVAVAVPTSHQPHRNRLLSMLLSRSLLPTNHFGTDCSACCRRGPYSHQPLRNRLLSTLPSRSLLPTNHFVAIPISHQPLRNRLLSMFPSRSLLPPTTSEPTAQHVAVAVPTPTKHFVAVPISHQPLRNRLLTVADPTSHQPLRNRLLSILPSRSL